VLALASLHPKASKPPTQPTAITIKPLIIMNVSSLVLNIAHLVKKVAMTNQILDDCKLESCGSDATTSFFTVAR
jgi:hypothetical protein